MRSNEFIIEATYDLDNDVDMLYDIAFADIVKAIKSGTWDGEEPPLRLGTTKMLTSPDCIKADKENRMNIVTTQDNQYNPYGTSVLGPFISIAINQDVLEIIRRAHNSFTYALELIPSSQHDMFKTEITPERIKGSIHHELSHWLDDTFHNRHISNRLEWSKQAAEKHKDYKKASNIITQGKKNVGLSNYEINAQIHAIKQLKRANEKIWDLLSFEDMIKLNASLTQLMNDVKKIGEYGTWKKALLKRMYREKLLGKEMYRNL